jgi:hypothetical protein
MVDTILADGMTWSNMRPAMMQGAIWSKGRIVGRASWRGKEEKKEDDASMKSRQKAKKLRLAPKSYSNVKMDHGPISTLGQTPSPWWYQNMPHPS